MAKIQKTGIAMLKLKKAVVKIVKFLAEVLILSVLWLILFLVFGAWF